MQKIPPRVCMQTDRQSDRHTDTHIQPTHPREASTGKAHPAFAQFSNLTMRSCRNQGLPLLCQLQASLCPPYFVEEHCACVVPAIRHPPGVPVWPLGVLLGRNEPLLPSNGSLPASPLVGGKQLRAAPEPRLLLSRASFLAAIPVSELVGGSGDIYKPLFENSNRYGQ